MPGWDDLITRYGLTELKGGSDLVVIDGDIALARTGDLMLRDEEHSALFRFANALRYSWPALAHAFSLMQQASDRDAALEEKVAKERFLSGASTYRDAMEEHSAKESSALVCAEGVLMTGSRLLLSLKLVLGCDAETWRETTPQIKGHSIGRLFEAAANHLRHCEEWRLSPQLNSRQRPSIEVLAALLDEPFTDDRHTFGSNRSVEILTAIAGLSLNEFVSMLSQYANNLTSAWRRHQKLVSR